MKVDEAREAARQWALREAVRLPGFLGAYTAGSANWLAGDAELPAGSDFDIMVVLDSSQSAPPRRKFLYRDALLEVSSLGAGQLQSPEEVLGDYHLAPSLRTAGILADPTGHLTLLRAAVSSEYTRPDWILRRCAHARSRVLEHLDSISSLSAWPDRIGACLFAAGIAVHVLLAAGLGNPTVRTRYRAVRELLAAHGRLDVHETLLELLGASRIAPAQARRHLDALVPVFDAAAGAVRTPFPFACDLSTLARPAAFDAGAEWIDRGDHREAMFWIAVTHTRCQQVLARRDFEESYRELTADLGIATPADLCRRRDAIAGSLPQIEELARKVALNQKSEVRS